MAGFDTSVWRERGDPLVAGAADGPLAGETVAVKDLFAVAGFRCGAGNPTLLHEAHPAAEHAPVVARLLAAGAAVRGIAQTDELAYSLAGTNHHHGTPPNPAAPGRVPGGSSSGPASAVALGEASIGLGTDTGGSVRVPAAYQGLFGIRTTHGAVDREGVVPLAPTFDTVGWLTRDLDLLRRVAGVLLPDAGPAVPQAADPVVVPELLALAEPGVAAAVARALPDTHRTEGWRLGDLASWRDAFVVLQAWEAWQAHGPVLDGRLDVLGPDVRARFERARTVTPAEAEEARSAVVTARRTIHELVGDRVVVLPSAPGPAPEAGPGLPARLLAVREATLALTCIAGIGGLPAVSVPLRTADGLPCGLGLVAAPGRDHDLLDVAAAIHHPGPG